MFDLKKYKVVKAFNGYREGICVSFNGADAKKYANFIISLDKPVIESVETVEAPVEPTVKKTIKRVKKGRK